ncbi:large ribosomal subunit protein mL66-like [Babylonia areolata]|uniref:large ribosomal subunit protein mL66-like n=1 Tax=Babylonia areolata TaxID=304850 RepID=UPI003FD0666D
MFQSILRRLHCSVNAAKIAVDSYMLPSFQMTRTISVSSTNRLKQIEQVTEGNVTKIEGKMIDSERAPYLVKHKESAGCTLCKIHPHLKYTDVLILSQFLRPDGCLLSRQVTGVCWAQQKRLAVLVNKAQRAGLLPQFRPPHKNGKPRTSHRSNYKWKRYNVYFKE